MSRNLARTIVAVLLAGLFLAVAAAPVPGATMPDPRIARFGIGFSREHGYAITDYALDKLKIGDIFPFGWYSDWEMNANPARPMGMEYVQLVRVHRNVYHAVRARLPQVVPQVPGSLWLIGNEPECIYQDARTPTEYAQVYHDLYGLIRGLDPTARIAVGGVVQPTPLRLRWLDQVLAEYQRLYGQPMPVDVWTIHNQILQEHPSPLEWGAGIPVGITDTTGALIITLQENASLDRFKQHVRDFRRWMKERGFQDKELIISEYGVLMPSEILVQDNIPAGNQMVIDFMLGSFDFLLNATDVETGCPTDGYRLVQRWLWYSLNEQPYDNNTGRGFNGALFVHNRPTELTVFGQAFKRYLWNLYGKMILFPLILRQFPR